MTPFRQAIRPGDQGSDVLAYKHALKRIGVKGSGTMNLSRRAGPAFVTTLERVQRNHGIPADGIAGKATHAVVAPHFSAYDGWLYRQAKIRKPPVPPIPSGSAQQEAIKLLQYRAAGKYHADNPGDLRDLQNTANGNAVWSQGGYWVHIDPRPLRLLVWLIDEGWEIGTYAICSDHFNDGPHGHAGGFAVDIQSISGKPIGSGGMHDATLKLAKKINSAPSGLRPRQQICGGASNVRYSDISACSIPGADSFYGSTTMLQHCNHVHCGF